MAGHSWGAGVALAIAERHPERVSAVVMICPVVPDERLGWSTGCLPVDARGPLIARAGFVAAGTTLRCRGCGGGSRGRLPGFDGARIDEVAREWRSGRAWRSFWVEQRALFRDLPALGERPGALAAPVTVVVGAEDHVTDPEASRRFAEAVGARLVEVPALRSPAAHAAPRRGRGRNCATATPGRATFPTCAPCGAR